MRLYDDWSARKRREVPGIAGLDARAVTPSTRDLSSVLRAGRGDLVAIPTLAADPASAGALCEQALAAGITALAIATDAAQGGSLLSLGAASEAAAGTPLLRLDLVLEESQVHETRLAGGDAVLLPTPLLARDALARLARAARSTLMTPVHLVHDDAGWERAAAAGARFVLVSAERLDGNGEDLEAALGLCARIPGRISICLAAPSLTTAAAVRALFGRVDGALLAPAFSPEAWAEVAVVDGPG